MKIRFPGVIRRHVLFRSACAVVFTLLLAAAAPAAFHEMQIEQVVGGVDSDTNAQAIQLRMRSGGQQFVGGAKLTAFDATGQNPVQLIQFSGSAPSGGAGKRILIASAAFQQHTDPQLTPDFVLTNLIPPGYLAAGRIVYTNSSGSVYWSLAFGGNGYTGSNTGLSTNGAFGTPFAGPLPSSGLQSLHFNGSGTDPSQNNSTDYTLTAGAATFTNNAGTSATVVPGGILPRIVRGDVRVGLQTIYTGLGSPLDLMPAPDGTNRLFVADQAGQVRLIKNGKMTATPFLDVTSRLVALSGDYDERGLLGLAFHPDFNNASSAGYRKLYTYTSEPPIGVPDFTVPVTGDIEHQAVIAEWQVSLVNADVVDTSTRREVLRIDKPQSNHNGGQIAFRPADGYLYIALGDGGGGNDNGDGHGATGNGQNLTNVLGKILRIDPIDPALTPASADAASANTRYRVPASNPFVGVAGVDEIFAYGLRNPYRFSFDATADRLLVADVGQNNVEEVDLVEKGKNYGWRLKEGSFLFDSGGIEEDPNPDPNLINPTLEYSHEEGSAVIGGFVYRGTAIPELVGRYIFGDFSGTGSGRIFYGDLDTGAIKELNIGFGDDLLNRFLKGFGQDQDGELYVLAASNSGPGGTTGQILKMVPVTLTATAIGDPVTGLPGAAYAAFGIPQAGAFAGSVKVNAKIVPAIFATDGSLLRMVGDAAPGISGSVITKLGAPSGDAALATLKANAGGVTAKTNVALLAGLSTGTLRVAAQTGTANGGLPSNVTIKSFGAIDGNGSEIFFLATLQGDGITAKNAAALCVARADGSVKILAQVTTVAGGKPIATLGTLLGSKGSLAEGRWRLDETTFGIRASFAGPPKSQTLYGIPSSANDPTDWTEYRATGPASGIGTIGTTTISSFGLPNFSPASFAALANLAMSPGTVTASNNAAIVAGPAGSPASLIRRKGDPIAADADGNALTGVTVKTLSDPVTGRSGRVAYLVTATGKGFGSGIEYSANFGTPSVLANVGATAPGGGRWASFTSLVLPDGLASGPIFTAKLATSATEHITAQNNFGLWAVDTLGELRLLLRTNERVFVKGANRTLKSFTALTPSPGSAGAASGHDRNGNVAVLAVFTDGTKALLKLTVP